MLATCSCVGVCWCFEGMDCSIVMSKTQPSSIIVPGFICESVVACWHNQHRELPAPADVACSASRFGQLVLHVENGLLKIFLSVCGSSTPAPSCQDERRRQMSFAAAAAAVPRRGRVACARLLHHSSPALEPQHSPNSSHSLLVQAT